MKRIYSSYIDSEYELVAEMAKEYGFSSVSAFQHYCVMYYADMKGNTTPLNILINKMIKNLDTIEVGGTFMVSALLPDEWNTLARDEKSTLSKQLSIHIRQNPHKYEKYKESKGKTNIYRKIG